MPPVKPSGTNPIWNPPQVGFFEDKRSNWLFRIDCITESVGWVFYWLFICIRQLQYQRFLSNLLQSSDDGKQSDFLWITESFRKKLLWAILMPLQGTPLWRLFRHLCALWQGETGWASKWWENIPWRTEHFKPFGMYSIFPWCPTWNSCLKNVLLWYILMYLICF